AESDQFGVELPSRKLVYGEKDTVFLGVDGWVDITNEQNNSVTLVLDNLPDNTPKGAAIYVAGSFNNWYPKDRETRLQQNAQGKWQVTIPRQADRIEFKFTRGHWGAEEVDARGRLIGNRSFTFGDADTLHLSVPRWKDHRKLNSKHVTFVVTQLPAGTPKDADLYLTSDGNGWDPKDENNRLQKNEKGQYAITLPRPSRRMQYKFTRGSWNTVEADGGGNEMRNRQYRNDGREEVFIEIASWTDAVRREHKHITFVLESLPKETPPNVKLYLASDINGWDPRSEKHVFQPMGDGRYTLTMQRPPNKKMEYKVTRGDWGSVEAKRKGRDIENRVHRFNMRDTVFLNVTGWIDR
ncbi:MAG: hypothetical protein AAGB22_01130, partial [Bacteroidota bacterium]